MKLRRKIVCPNCLEQRTIKTRLDENNKEYYSCLACNSVIPREYAENTSSPVEVVSAVGFRGHGKTLYFSSLFYSIDKLASIWPGFYSFAADERSLDTIKDNISKLKKGELPPPSPASFPIPTNVRLANLPALGDRFFLFYDTGGESYTRASKLIKYAGFVRRSHTAVFLVSLEDLDYDGSKLHELLSIYVQGLTELAGKPGNQHLLVVFSKGDLLGPKLNSGGSGSERIWQYLTGGEIKSLNHIKILDYIKGMQEVSADLREFTGRELNALQFINFAQDQFRSVEFSLISSLGAKPVGNRLQVEINPKRLFDPLLWIAYRSLNRLGRTSLLWRK
jgi:hypothetical protein